MTDPGDLPASDAWQLRQAFVGKDADTAGSIRTLLATGKDGLQKEAARALVARAATMVTPDAKLAADAPELISAMLAGGYEDAAARWIPVIGRMDDANADRCWAILALGAPNIADVGTGRINSFIRRDKSANQVRSALLVAGLRWAGPDQRRHGQFAQPTVRLGAWTSHQLDQDNRAAAARGRERHGRGACRDGFQTSRFDRVPSAHLYHAVSALQHTGQDSPRG